MILFATVAKKCNPPHLSRGGVLLVEAIEVFRGEFERYRNMQQVHSAVPRRDVVCPDNWPARSKTCSGSGRNKKIPSRISFSKYSMRPVPGIRKAPSGKLAGAARSPLPIRQRP